MIKIDNMIDSANHGRSSFVMLNELKGYMRCDNVCVDMILTHPNGKVWIYPDVKISSESYEASSTDLHCTCDRCYYRKNGKEIWSKVGGGKVDIALMNGFVNLMPAKSIEFKMRQHLEYFDHMMIEYPNNETVSDEKVDTSLDVLQSNAPRKLIDITRMSRRGKLVLFKYIIDKITLFDPNVPDDVAIRITGFNKDCDLVDVMFAEVEIRGCNYASPAFNFRGMDIANGMVGDHDCDIFGGKFDDKVNLMTIKFITPTCDIEWVFGSHKQTVEILEKGELK